MNFSLLICLFTDEIGFNPALYTVARDLESKNKQAIFTTAENLKEDILDKLTACDVKVLVKTAEEFSQANHFQRIFPSKISRQYFQYFDTVSYYDLLLDAFEAKYGANRKTGIQWLDQYCRRNIHKQTNKQ